MRLASEKPEFLDRYSRCFSNTWSDDTPIEQVRFVALDCEATGLNPKTDRLVTIGAVAVKGGEIDLSDSFEALLKVAFNTAAVTVHGVTREEAREGWEEPDALEGFLHYLKDGVIVGHHIGHDIEIFNAACQRWFGIELRNRSIDTMGLALHLERGGAFRGRARIADFSLDGLCEFFGVTPHDRHTAPGDAFLTAQIFLRLLKLAVRHGRGTLGRLAEPWRPEQR